LAVFSALSILTFILNVWRENKYLLMQFLANLQAKKAGKGAKKRTNVLSNY